MLNQVNQMNNLRFELLNIFHLYGSYLNDFLVFPVYDPLTNVIVDDVKRK